MKKTLMKKPKNMKVATTTDSADHGEPANIQAEDDQNLRSLLTSIDKDQLVDILATLGAKIPQAAQGIIAEARPNASHRKLIVRRLDKKTTSQTLAKAFSIYGEIEHANVLIDRTIANSRAIGFITFKSLESVTKALEKKVTWVDGLLAFQRLNDECETQSGDANPRKLFVTGVSSDTTTEMFLDFFAKYGKIEKGSVIYDKTTNKSKDFGYVTFKTVEAAEAAMSDPNKILGGSKISVRVKWFQIMKNQVQHESVTDAPRIHNSSHHDIVLRQNTLQSQVPRPHFSGYETRGIPRAIQPPAEANQLLFRGYEPRGIPQAYQQPVEAYPGYEPHIIPRAYQPPAQAYRPQFRGYEPNIIPRAYQPPAEAYRPQVRGYEPHISPRAYQPPAEAYRPQFRGYEPNINPRAYQPPVETHRPQFRGYEPNRIPLAIQRLTEAYRSRFSGHDPNRIPLANQRLTEAYQPHFSGYEPYIIPLANQPPAEAYQPYFSGFETYGFPTANQPPSEGYRPQFFGYETYEFPPEIQPPTVAYSQNFSAFVPYGIPTAYQTPTGFMAYPYYFSYQ